MGKLYSTCIHLAVCSLIWLLMRLKLLTVDGEFDDRISVLNRLDAIAPPRTERLKERKELQYKKM